jgi:hypothetical protein
VRDYEILFIGRKAGAIGIFYTIAVTIQAENYQAALLKLGETHEYNVILTHSGGAPEDIPQGIKANTCPYCGASYTLRDGGCHDKCAKSQQAAALVREAATEYYIED